MISTNILTTAFKVTQSELARRKHAPVQPEPHLPYIVDWDEVKDEPIWSADHSNMSTAQIAAAHRKYDDEQEQILKATMAK